jgi:SAM-dependent methyltransferase
MLRDWTPKKLAWSLRKLTLKIPGDALVLDVGSGSNPHPRADILLEKFINPLHRYEALVADRPTVLADAARMPFRDKTFDYVIAFHVLEHVKDPATFLSELQRIGKAGYIETPNVLFERLFPYDVHVLEIMDANGVLVINKKAGPHPDEYISELEVLKISPDWKRLFYANPKLFHVQYHWNERIRYRVTNQHISLDWLIDIRKEEHSGLGHCIGCGVTTSGRTKEP